MAKIAVHLITGFLGSGKTSLIKEYLQNNQSQDTALIINEIGEISLDERVLQHYSSERILKLSSGCVCCNKRLDLIESLKNILNEYELRWQKPKRIIIESTGLANPAPILWTLMNDIFLNNHFFVKSVITCIDSINALSHLENEEAIAQIIASDLIIICKSDIKKPSSELIQKLKSINLSLEIKDKAELDFQNIFDINHRFLTNEIPTNKHEQSFDTISLSFDNPLEWNAFGVWLSMLLHKWGKKILRVKGVLDINKNFLVAINGVGHIIHSPTHIPKDRQGSSLVFITRGFESKQILDSLNGFKRLLEINMS